MPAPDGELGAIANAGVRAFGSLAYITVAPDTFHFESGDYAFFYIRPQYRLGSSLLSSREILVVCAVYSHLHARTIKAAEGLLQRARGRLEPGMVVLLHQDANGNEQLRDWGREQGLTVLPVYVRGSIPEGDDLEAVLCSGLYSHDPFDLAGPVRQAHQFFGRAEIPDMARRLRQGHIQALFGMRKIGKTSVLNRVVDEATQFHGMSCAVADCSDDSLSGMKAGQLLNSIAGSVNEALNHNEDHYCTVVPLAGDESPSEAGRFLLDVVASANRPVLVALDEIDYISPSSPVAPHWRDEFNSFFRAFRFVYQECTRRDLVLSIVLSGVSSRWFTVDEIAGVENSALAFVPETYLPPLERTQAISMITSLGRAAGLVFAAEAADEIAMTCSDVPFWIRKAGSYVNSCFAQADRPVRLSRSDIAGLCSEFVEVEGGPLAYSSLRHLFRIYPELSTVAVDSVRDHHTERLPQELLSILGRYAVLGEGFAASGPLVDAGLATWERNQPADAPLPFDDSPSTRQIEAGSTSAAGEEEWAELLGEVSQRRNVLERRMRDFVLLVVRLKCGERSDGRGPDEVVLAAVPVERREALKGRNTSAMIQAMYWLELIAIVKKNWAWFGAYFGDRKQLDLFVEIVNDRPDAHAKDFDGAELALQRRAIGWLDQAITRSGLL